MSFLRKPKLFIVQSPDKDQSLVFESTKKATSAIVVRRHEKEPWRVHDVYESVCLAESTKPWRQLANSEMTAEQIYEMAEKAERPSVPWEYVAVVPVEGFLHPLLWHGMDRNRAEKNGEVPVPIEIAAQEALDVINIYRATMGLEAWVVDNTAMAPGFFMLYNGTEGPAFGQPSAIYQNRPVKREAMDAVELLCFLQGAVALYKEAEVRRPDSIRLDEDELDVLQEKLLLSAPQLHFRIRQAIKQAKEK